MLDDDTAAELAAEGRHQRSLLARLMRHPDPRDPDHPLPDTLETDPGTIEQVLVEWLADMSKVGEYSIAMDDRVYQDIDAAVALGDGAGVIEVYRAGLRSAMLSDATHEADRRIKHENRF